MANDGGQTAARESLSVPTIEESSMVCRPQIGLFSRMWNGIFRMRSEDFEKKLQYLSKEEASVHARIKWIAQSWRKLARYIVVISILLELVAVFYAILKTRSSQVDWKERALRVVPIFVIPGLSFAIYSACSWFIRMWGRKDQKTLERLRAERRVKIDELKEKTNYYLTQQLIQRFDTDPAAKAAAAAVLASKLGADSGLKLLIGDESKLNVPVGKSSDVEFVQSNGLRNRKEPHARSKSTESVVMQQFVEEMPNNFGLDGQEVAVLSQSVVMEHHPRLAAKDGGWMARIAAMLVGEDPDQSYALICGNCHMHNGLARKEDFPYTTYYCPHCNALNGSRQAAEGHAPGANSGKGSPQPLGCGETSSSAGSVSESEVISSPTGAVSGTQEPTKGKEPSASTN